MPPPAGQSASGNQGTVVQIIGDGNTVTIAGAIALRLRSFSGPAFSTAPADEAQAGEAGYTRNGREELRLLSPHNLADLPLIGRGPLLDSLRTWLAGDAAVSVQVLTGPGGSGKTRLAAELANEARQQGWTAGFAAGDALDTLAAHDYDTGRDAPTFVVVDYVAAKVPEVGAWLRNLVHQNLAGSPKLRLLLLERTGRPDSGWWRELFTVGDPTGRAVKGLLALPDAPLMLGPLADAGARHAVFRAAWEAAGGGAVPVESPGLDRALVAASLGGAPLFLAMFGLTAVRQGMAAVQGMSADTLALALADQELERIGRIWEAHGLARGRDRPLHAHLAAVATLCGGLGEDATHRMIARESRVLRQSIPTGQTESARAALHAALPEDHCGVGAILPDIIGEAAMIRAWAALPDYGVGVVRRAAKAGHRPAVIRNVVRACQDFLIRGEETPLHWLRELQASATQLEALIELAEAFPVNSISLRESARALTQTLVDKCRRLPPDRGRPLLASVLNNLSTCLARLDRHVDAFNAAKEAVEIYRDLVGQAPGSFNLNFPTSLNNLANRYATLGNNKEALRLITEAVDICRNLVGKDSDKPKQALARSLHNQAIYLVTAGLREEAFASANEAVHIYRCLASKASDIFPSNLASALSALSLHLIAIPERGQEALCVARESVNIYRILIVKNQDSFMLDLVGAIINLCNLYCCFTISNCSAEMFEFAEEAVKICRDLADRDPDAFSPYLANALNNQSVYLAISGRHGEAHDAIVEAVRIDHEALTKFLPAFFRHPKSLASRLAAMLQTYQDRCARAGIEPDKALIGPAVAQITKIV